MASRRAPLIAHIVAHAGALEGDVATAAHRHAPRQTLREIRVSSSPIPVLAAGTLGAAVVTDIVQGRLPQTVDWRRVAPLGVPPSLAEATDALAYAAEPERMVPGEPTLLTNGDDAFAAMLDAIAGAVRYVHLETYIYEADDVGWRFADALASRARAGVKVRLLYDAFGGMSVSWRLEQQMRRAGIELVAYNPILRRTHRLWRRDHRKLLIVDGRVAFTGGVNIGRHYASRERGGEGWRDTHVALRGSLVADLEASFRAVWIRAGGAAYPAYPPRAREHVAGRGTQWMTAVASDDIGQRTAIRRHLLHAVRAARSSIYIANAYFIPDRGLRRALVRAAARGVEVHVLIPGESDLRSVQLAGEHTYGALLRGGVRLHQWRGAHMHAKTVVVDGVWSSVGTFNLDYASLFYNLEIVVEIVGRELGAAMVASFEDDLARAVEITPRAWAARGWALRVLQALAYRLRRWM